MPKKPRARLRTGEPYVRTHNGSWHLFYRNPDPTKNYPSHRSLHLKADERRKAETIEAEARLVWRECEPEFDLDPSKVEGVFARLVEDKIEGRRRRSASELKTDYLERTLGSILDRFLASKQSKAKRTREFYESHINQFRRLMRCTLPIAGISPEHIREYLRNRVESEKVHKATANKELTTLRSIFSFALKQAYIENDPTKMVDRFSLDAEDKEQLSEPVYVTPDAYEALIRSQAARKHPPVRDLMFLLYHTGMRIGELLRLRWKDIDIASHVIHVSASPQKGGDRNPYMVSRELRLYLGFARNEAERIHAARQTDDSMFFENVALISNGHGNPWTYTNLARRVWRPFLKEFAQERPEIYRRLAQAAGTTKEERRPISFHDFRHTFITDLLAKGVNPVIVGWIVGHKELHTQRRYTHLCYSHFQKEFEGFKR